jgi:hypothetical protein
VVVWLFIAGDHEPGIPLFELLGKLGMAVPMQKGPTGVKAGVTFGIIVIV